LCDDHLNYEFSLSGVAYGRVIIIIRIIARCQQKSKDDVAWLAAAFEGAVAVAI
jgi:hypothetical protein